MMNVPMRSDGERARQIEKYWHDLGYKNVKVEVKRKIVSFKARKVRIKNDPNNLLDVPGYTGPSMEICSNIPEIFHTSEFLAGLKTDKKAA